MGHKIFTDIFFLVLSQTIMSAVYIVDNVYYVQQQQPVEVTDYIRNK